MQFSRAVLSKDLRILDTLNKGSVWEFLLCFNKGSLLTELAFCTQTSEA